MKRSLFTTLIIGGAIAAIVSALHATGLLRGLETAVGALVSDYASATRVVSGKMAVCFYFVAGFRRCLARSEPCATQAAPAVYSFLLVIELLGLSWVCSLYRVFFQPLPSIFAVVLALIATEGWTAFLAAGSLAFSADILRQPAVEEGSLRRVREGTISFDVQPEARTKPAS